MRQNRQLTKRSNHDIMQRVCKNSGWPLAGVGGVVVEASGTPSYEAVGAPDSAVSPLGVRQIEREGHATDRHAVFPVRLEHLLGPESLLGKFPLRCFSHLLIVILAVGIVGSGGLGQTGSSGMLSLQRTMGEPSPFAHYQSALESDLLVKNPDVVTRLVNRPRERLTTHVVAENETIATIAEKYNISVQTILWANNLEEDSVVHPGKVLTILPVSGILHSVRPGETIDEIAWKYKSDVRAIVDFNQLTDPDRLEANHVLVVPGGRKEDQPRAVVTTRSMRPPDDMVTEEKDQALKPSSYEVQAGDTLGGIAERFGISQDTIIAANGLGENPDLLQPGQKLTILPVSGVLYTVKEGDTLSGIASAFGVESDKITSANALSNADLMSVGQKLVIPGAKAVWRPPEPTEPSVTHVVQSGESIRYIAEIYNVNPAKIIRANGLRDADVLQVGQKLEIPGGQAPAVASVARPAASPRAEAPAPQPAARPAPAPAPQPAPAPAPAPSGGDAGWKIVEVASKYLGSRYVWGGTSPAGFDCSGFVWYVYKTAGSYVPRDLWGQLQAGPRVKQDNLLPGDIVFFENTYTYGLSHDGIYIGGGRFIHAASEREGVTISSLSERYWAARYYGASRPW
mgnify:FL=1